MVLPNARFTSLICASLVCLTFVAATTGRADSRPTRSECIVGFRLDWSQVRADQDEIRHSLFLRPEEWRTIYGTRGPRRPAMAMTYDGTHLYLQFPRDCERKQDLAAELIAFWRAKGLDLPRFERIDGPIVPSLDTIEVWGPAWKDTPEDIPPKLPDKQLQPFRTDHRYPASPRSA